MYLLNLRTSDARDIAVPVRLPQSVTFDCFVPGLGIMAACLHPTSLDPAQADMGNVDVWNDDGVVRTHLTLMPHQDDAAVEQAGDVLSFIVDRLNAELTLGQDFTLRAIADMADAEARAREAWESLPGAIRSGMLLVPPVTQGMRETPSSAALDEYVIMLTEQAQQMAEKAAKERKADWMQVQAEEHAESQRATRTDAGIDAMKEEP
jgi:hypothetical protein